MNFVDQSAIKIKKKRGGILEIIIKIKNHEIAQNAASLEDRAAPQQEGISSRTGFFSRKNKRAVQESSINWNQKTLQNRSNPSYSMASSNCSCPIGEF